MSSTLLIATTRSICPECKKTVTARIVEEQGSVYLLKDCSEHGPYKVRIAKYAWHYRGLNLFYQTLFPKGYYADPLQKKILFYHCSSQCNMACNVCFSHGISDVPVLPFSECERLLERVSGIKDIHLLGGEPTMNEDLCGIIAALSRKGHKATIYTNGLRLADEEYVRALKRAGIHHVNIGIDSFSDKEVYMTMRGQDVRAIKQKALANLQRLGVSTGIVDSVVKKVNEHSIGEIMAYSRKNRYIRKISFRGYSAMGRKFFSSEHEYTMDALIEAIQQQTQDLLTLEEMYMYQRLINVYGVLYGSEQSCYMKQYLRVPRGRQKKIRDIFPPDVFNRQLDVFQERYPESPDAAKREMRSLLKRYLIKSPVYAFLLKTGSSWLNHFYLYTEVAMFYSPYTLDLDMMGHRCSCVWVPSLQAGPPTDYCSYLSKQY